MREIILTAEEEAKLRSLLANFASYGEMAREGFSPAVAKKYKKRWGIKT